MNLDKFVYHKGMIEQKNGGQANEKELFHEQEEIIHNKSLILRKVLIFDSVFKAHGVKPTILQLMLVTVICINFYK